MENNDEKELKDDEKQEVNKAEELKKESEKKGKLGGKKTVKGKKLSAFIIAIIVIALAISYGSGFILGKILYEKKDKIIVKEQVNDKDDNQNDDNKEESKKDIVPYTDKFAMRKVYEDLDFYLIDNGDLYYTNSDFVLTHSGCMFDSTNEYCKFNKDYGNKMTKVEGISNVKRVKMYNKPGATDESFQYYAITEDGNVYALKGTEVTVFLDNHDVEDMLAQNDGIEILLKNGKHMLYSWKFKDDFKVEYKYTEIK